MAQNNSIITGKLQGSLGGELVFREWDGKTVVAKSPRSRKGGRTPAQEETQDKFLMAARYAKAIITAQDKGLAEAYANMLKPRQNVYSRALEDFLTVPVIKSINTGRYRGMAGDIIAVRPLDDFRVTSVRLAIHSANGVLLEEGDALQNPQGIEWVYTTTLANNLLEGSKVTAIATDIPNNEGALEITL